MRPGGIPNASLKAATGFADLIEKQCPAMSPFTDLPSRRPPKRQKTLLIKGHNMHGWHIVAKLLREGETLEGTTKNFSLRSCGHEPLDYYRRNQPLVDAETEEGQRRRTIG